LQKEEKNNENGKINGRKKTKNERTKEKEGMRQ
jgi:hypothetical protein